MPNNLTVTGDSLVSICLPTFNGGRFFQSALDCISAQSYGNIEVIVSDDGSTDDTLFIADQFSKSARFPVRVLRHARGALADNWNYSVERARGKYIKFLFQDDLIEPNCVARMVEAAESEPNVVMVFCTRTILVEADSANDEHAKSIKQWCTTLHTGWTHLQEMQEGRDLLADPLLISGGKFNKVGEPSAVLLQRDALVSMGGFDPQLVQLVDVDAWLRMFAMGKVAFIDEALASFRIHTKQQSIQNARSGAMVRDQCRFFAKTLRGPLRKRLHPDTVWMMRYLMSRTGKRGRLLAYVDQFKTVGGRIKRRLAMSPGRPANETQAT